MERANLPSSYWEDIAFKNIPASAPYRDQVGKYLKNLPEFLDKGIGLYLWSNENGTGKTTLAALALRRALLLGNAVYFIRSQALKEAAIENLQFDLHYSVMARARYA